MNGRLSIISQARTLFEQRNIDPHLLTQLYREYNPIPNMNDFIVQSQALFPNLNCGLASLYLMHVLKEGSVHQGCYGAYAHSFLVFEDQTIADITADQYDGPRVYYGPLKTPWKLRC